MLAGKLKLTFIIHTCTSVVPSKSRPLWGRYIRSALCYWQIVNCRIVAVMAVQRQPCLEESLLAQGGRGRLGLLCLVYCHF